MDDANLKQSADVAFAYLGTNDAAWPSANPVINLHLFFHRRAQEVWLQATRARERALFVELACEAITHSATSLSILLGQNTQLGQGKDRTPWPREMVAELFDDERAVKECDALFKLAEAVRHFGPLKQAEVGGMTLVNVGLLLESARRASIDLVRRKGGDCGAWERVEFSVPNGEG